MKKPFIVTVVIFIILLIYIYFSSSYINFYNTEFLHPLFWTLIPLTCLLFLCIFLKRITPKSVLITILSFGVVDFIILFGIPTTCSQIVCYDRNTSALIISSLFSIVYFIVLLFQNKSKISM